MGCRGCAGTAGYLLRDCGSVGPQPLPMSFCCAVMTRSPHMLLKGRVLSGLRAKDHLRTPGGGFPRYCAPQKVQTGSAAAGWRPGRRRATRLPTEERATQRARREQCVGTCDRGLKEGAARRRHLYAASYGRWLLSKACHFAQPCRATELLQGFGLFFLSRLERLPSDWWRTS